jgi:hypothetical protein
VKNFSWLPLLVTSIMVLGACGGGGGDQPDAGAPCDPATSPPSCSGDTLFSCTDGAETPTDCAADGLVCGDVGDGAACVDECELLGVDAAGECAPGGIRRCEDSHVVLVPCDGGSHCDAGGGAPVCVSDACSAVGPQGRCAGDTLASCDSGDLVETDCASTGDVCAYVSDAAGYACVDPGATGDLRVDGIVRYEDKPPQTSGSLGAITQVVARGARVSVVRDSDSAVLATAMTADDGSFVLRYDATAAAQVHVLAAAQNPTTARPISVVNNQNRVHGQAAASFAATATTTSNVLATDASGVSEAFNLLDQMTLTMDMIRGDLGDPTPTSLVVHWFRGSSDGTYFDGSAIHMLGEASDDDGYDDTVALHESGHYVEDTQGRSDNPGGFHDGSPADPNLGWSEGFSTYLAMALDGRPIYVDSNSGGGWAYNADTENTTANGAGAIGQDVSENLINEVLWDMADAPAKDDDGVASGDGEVLRVQSEYLRSATLRNVGEAGVDLVDFLDGWFLSQGLGACTAASSLIVDTHHFPYDFAGPAGTCP